MKKTWKHTAILTLLLIGIMQVIPFVPTHNNCQAACCAEAVSCCETQVDTGCDMAMTSCNTTVFVPLISAPLIKVESNVHMDIALNPVISGETFGSQEQVNLTSFVPISEAPPPLYLPLLI